MWQVYQDLANSDTAAQEEIDGLVDQIQESMTTEQMKSISDMNLTQQDVFALMQEQNIGMAQSQRSSGETFSFSPNSGGGPGGGGDPDGGGPPDGGMAPPDGGMGGDIGAMGGAGPSTGTDQTQGAGAGSSLGGTAGASTALVGALIQYLEQIASA